MFKVFNAFAQKKGLQLGAFRFLLDGTPINTNDDEDITAASLGLEDQDMIDCFLAQVGGLDVVVF